MKTKCKRCMKIYSVLDKKNNVTVFKSLRKTVEFLTDFGDQDIYEDGARMMLKLEKKDIEWLIKSENIIYLHTTPTYANYYFRVQKHDL